MSCSDGVKLPALPILEDLSTADKLIREAAKFIHKKQRPRYLEIVEHWALIYS